jgi:hypothetical protein
MPASGTTRSGTTIGATNRPGSAGGVGAVARSFGPAAGGGGGGGGGAEDPVDEDSDREAESAPRQ